MVTSAPHPSDSKFVVYSAYLHNQFEPRPQGPLRAFILSPFTFLWTTLPAHLTLERPALRFLNYLIASTIPGAGDESSIIYAFNDGISPVTSSLLLPDDFVAHVPIRNEGDIAKIRGHSSAHRARLFDDADHLTFIEEHRPVGSSENLTDVLSVNEKPRPMFDWILKDLLE